VQAVAQIAALVVAVANALTGAAGAWLWWRVEPARRWWLALRACQVLCAVAAVAGGVLYLAGFEPGDELFWLYLLLPVAVNFVAEQLRIASAPSVLEGRGLADAQAMSVLPSETQRSIVVQIMRRELGVMVLATLVTAFLLLRAAGTA
jgi:hypothetical protein